MEDLFLSDDSDQGKSISHLTASQILYAWREGKPSAKLVALATFLCLLFLGIHLFPPIVTATCSLWWMGIFASLAAIIYLFRLSPEGVTVFPDRIEVSYHFGRRLLPLGNVTAVRRITLRDREKGTLKGIAVAELVSPNSVLRIPGEVANTPAFLKALEKASPCVAIEDEAKSGIPPVWGKCFWLITGVALAIHFVLLVKFRDNIMVIRHDIPTMVLCLAVGAVSFLIAAAYASIVNAVARRGKSIPTPWSSITFSACTIAAIGMPFLSFEIIRAVNTGLDWHEGTVRTSYCLAKYVSVRYLSIHDTRVPVETRLLEVADWALPGHTITIPNWRGYDEAHKGLVLQVTTKQGSLGWEWLVSARSLAHDFGGLPGNKLWSCSW